MTQARLICLALLLSACGPAPAPPAQAPGASAQAPTAAPPSAISHGEATIGQASTAPDRAADAPGLPTTRH